MYSKGDYAMFILSYPEETVPLVYEMYTTPGTGINS